MTRDIEGSFQFNTVVSSMMEMTNELLNYLNNTSEDNWNLELLYEISEKFLTMLSLIAPYISEELWSLMGKKELVMLNDWPEVDEKALEQDEISIVLQVNGKVRNTISVPVDLSEDELKEIALKNEKVQKFIEDKKVLKVIYVPKKLVNIVIKG
jgi:leucyl-tRNA synthetase